MTKRMLSGFFLLLIISACSRAGEEIPLDSTQERIGPAVDLPLEQTTAAPEKPSSTPLPSPTGTASPLPPTATARPEIPTKAVLIYHDLSSGDGGGGSLYDYLLQGAQQPNLVLYQDGQLLIREGEWYLEANLSLAEACSYTQLISQAITNSEQAVRYNGTPTPEYGFFSGEPIVYLETAADHPLGHYYSVLEGGLLTEEFLRPFSLMKGMTERYQTKPYLGESLVLWVQSFTMADSTGTRDIPHSSSWPYYGMPNLERIVTENNTPLLILSGEEASALREELGAEPKITLYELREDQSRKFVILSRPLLPHESAADFQGEGAYGSFYQFGDLDAVCGQ